MEKEDNKKLFMNLMISVFGPLLGGAFMIGNFDLPLGKTILVVTVILGILNFFGLIKLEQTRSYRPMTLISFMIMISILFSFVLLEGLGELLHGFSLSFFHPVVVVFLMFSTLAIFKEKYYPLKFYLAINSLIIPLCWGGVLEREISFLNF